MALFSGTINDLAAKVDDLESKLVNAIAALEAQTAKDVTAIVDGLKSAILPEVQGMRASLDTAIVVISSSVTEVTNLAKRIDGATFHLGPEVSQFDGKPLA